MTRLEMKLVDCQVDRGHGPAHLHSLPPCLVSHEAIKGTSAVVHHSGELVFVRTVA